MLEVNHRHQLLRIRSHMPSVVILLLATFIPSMHQTWIAPCIALLSTLSLTLLFDCYDKHEPVVSTFHSFILLGISSILAPVLFLLLPFYIWYLTFFLRVISPRVFCASLIGFALPYWVYLGAYILGYVPIHLLWTDWQLTPLQVLSEDARFAFVSLVAFISCLHFLTCKYDDKIRTRMFLYILLGNALFSWVLLLFATDNSQRDALMAVFCVSVAPLIAHFMSLTHSLWSNITYWLILLGFITLWML